MLIGPVKRFFWQSHFMYKHDSPTLIKGSYVKMTKEKWLKVTL